MKKERPYMLMRLAILLAAVFAGLHAAEITRDDAMQAARRWIAMNAIFQAAQPEATPSKASRIVDDDGREPPLWQVELEPAGYLVMSADDALPPVIAFDTKGRPESPQGHPFPSMLKEQGGIFKDGLQGGGPGEEGAADENRSRWRQLLVRTRASSVTPSSILRQPMLATAWKQSAPFNLLCPSGSVYAERALTGCVPLTIAQLLKFHEWPVRGSGTAKHTDDEGDIQGDFMADYSFPYDWSLVKEKYGAADETAVSKEELAVARLAMEMGPFTGADYELGFTSAYSWNVRRLLSDNRG